MNRIALTRPSVIMSEASVTGPYRPSNDTARAGRTWVNSDHPLAPRHVKFTPPNAPKETPRAAPAPEQKPANALPMWRRIVGMGGALLASVGTVAGLISIVALGPVGLAVAAGAAVVGCVIIKASTAVKE